MIALVNDTLRSATGRYLTREEQERILDVAAGLPARFDAAEEVERHEDAVLRGALETLREHYPNFEHYHDQAWAKCYRDAQLVVRQAAQAMTFDDPQLLESRVTNWLRTIAAASNLTPGFVRELYALVTEGFRKALSPAAFAMFEPFLRKASSTLSDFPEPAAPAI